MNVHLPTVRCTNRNMRGMLWLGLTWCMPFAVAHAQDAADTNRPNIILIIADDLAVQDLGCYGHPTLKTPNIDRLANEGMRFTRAFVTASSCSPSRASLLTGRFPTRTDAEELHWPLPDGQPDFVSELRASGYWAAAAGKWHLGESAKQRFDVVLEADPAGYQLSPNAKAGDDNKIEVAAGADPSGCGDWLRTLRERPADKPFFLWLASLDPHRDYENFADNPTSPDDVVVPPYLPDDAELRRDLALYYDEIERLDGFVGQILDELDRQSLTDNTLVVFMSDNGRPFPREKNTLYDTGIHTPLLMRWPQHVKPSVCGSLVSSVDLSGTFLAIAGGKRWPRPAHDLQPLFDGSEQVIRKFTFAEKNWHDYAGRSRAVRDLRYKYIHNEYPDLPNTPPADVVRSLSYRAMQKLLGADKLTANQLDCFIKPRPVEELYDTELDPYELNNVANDPAYAEHLKRLRKRLVVWKRDNRDTPPAELSADEFDRESGAPLPNRIRPRPGKKTAGSSAP